MERTRRVGLLLGVSAVAACRGGSDDSAAPRFEGVAVAIQDETAVGFLDADGTLDGVVDLTSTVDGAPFPWMVHNVQLTPAADLVLATAMVPMDGSWTGEAPRDELVEVDVATRTVRRRCALDFGLGAAHVVTDGTLAWITGYDQDRVVVVDLASCATRARWPLPPGTRPHGIRRAADGDGFWVAGLGDGSVHHLDLDGAVTSWSLPGPAVQVAVLPDGSAVFVTLSSTRQVARVDVPTGDLAVFDLPAGTAGPAQVYPAPDSGAVWVADQGSPDGAILGRELLRVDARTGETTARVMVDEAPHGVVVSPDGRTVWATTLSGGTVDRVDAEALVLVGATRVGDGPNGLTLAEDGVTMP